MKPTKEQMKAKAIELMEKLDIYKPYVKDFKENDLVCYFEHYGGFWVFQEPKLQEKLKTSSFLSFSFYNIQNRNAIHVDFRKVGRTIYELKTDEFSVYQIIFGSYPNLYPFVRFNALYIV